MTNHPNRSAYRVLIAKLQRVSVDGDYAPDCRRLAIDVYQQMMVAEKLPRIIMSDASYINVYGLRGAQAAKRQDREDAENNRRHAMERAMDRAQSFIESWGL